MAGTVVAKPPTWDTTARTGPPSSSNTADQKKLLPVGGDPLSAVTEAPSVDHLSLTPRPALAAATERAQLLRKKVALPDPSYRQQQQQQ